MTLLNLPPLHPAKRIIEREPRRRPQPADWGLGMTVCMAALCESAKIVVAVSDEMITFEFVSADGLAIKNWPLSNNWTVLYSGDVGPVPLILKRARELVLKMDPATDDSTDPQKLADALREASTEQLVREVESRILAPLGLTCAQFWTIAPTLPPDSLSDLLAEISHVRLNYEFLLAGIDGEGQGHLMYLNERKAPISLDDVGFWAIGAGAQSAISSLSFHADRGRFNRFKSLSACIYHLCEAKFMAESTRTVGKRTFVTVFEQGREPRVMSEAGVTKIRKAWERSGAPRVPKGILSNIPALLWVPGEPKTAEQLAAIFGGRPDLAQRLLEVRKLLPETPTDQ